MPNWCLTNYALQGEEKEIKDLHEKMKSLQEMDSPLVPNGFGKTWLGCLVKNLGGDPEKINCRGDWSELKINEEGVLLFDTETAWARMDEVEKLIMDKYPSIKIYFIEEESGMGIFLTNDKEGKYFPDQIVIDQESDGEEYYTETDAITKIGELLNKDVKDWEQAVELVDRHNDQQDDIDGQEHIWLRRAEVCEE